MYGSKWKEIGYDLVVINGKAENDFLKSHVTSLKKYFWVGLNENEEKDSFAWIDGSDFTYGSTWKEEPWDRKKPTSVASLSIHCIHRLVIHEHFQYKI